METNQNVIKTSTGSRPCNEDKYIDEFDIHLSNDSIIKFYAVFDGHGGDFVSKKCIEKIPDLIREQIEKEDNAICNVNINIRHLGIARAFNEATEQLHKEINIKKLSGGSTALMILEDNDCIFIHQMGDCRATIGDVLTGEISIVKRAMVDCILDPLYIKDLKEGIAQTPIHAMPGLAIQRKNESVKSHPLCTKESMSEWKINDDDNEENAHAEWMTFNINHCKKKGKNNEITEAIKPRKDPGANAFRLSLCDTQPTRGISGKDEQIMNHGQTFRYELPIKHRSGKILVYGTDGIEDLNALPNDKILHVITSIDLFEKYFEENNLILKNISSSIIYPVNGTFHEKMNWLSKVAHSLPVDLFWKESVKKSAKILENIFENKDNVKAAFTGVEYDNISLLCDIILEYINIRGSADNVTIGIKKWL